MEQFKKLLTSLSLRQKIVILTAVVISGGALFGVMKWRKEADFKPLFTGLAAEDAGAVVAKLKESGVEYRLNDTGGAVLVPAARVAELRLSLASAGLPKSGRVGFELFDRNNFGATEFTEHVNYRRALEGELERTVMSLSEVEQARIHLTFPKESVFLESKLPAKGSVIVRLRPGKQMTAQNIAAICHLVSSGVEGLQPESVSVVDTRGNLLSRARRAGLDGTDASDSQIDYRQKLEKDLLQKINTTLDPLLGTERYRAAVSMDCDFSSGETSEELYDPTKSVMATSHTTDDGYTGAAGGGQPGAASNLPRPPAQVQTASAAGVSRKTEELTFQTSRSVRHIKLAQGTVKRMSISILLDQDLKWEGKGPSAKRTVVPPSPEKIKSIKDIVAGIAGVAADRGDQIVVESLPFDSTLNAEPPELLVPPPAPPAPFKLPFPLPPWAQKFDPKLLLGAAAAVALLLLGLVTMALRMGLRKLKKKNGKTTAETARELPPTQDIVALSEATAGGGSGELSAGGAGEDVVNTAIQALQVKPVITKRSETLSKQLREGINQNPDVTLHLLRSWIREEEA